MYLVFDNKEVPEVTAIETPNLNEWLNERLTKAVADFWEFAFNENGLYEPEERNRRRLRASMKVIRGGRE